MPQLPIVEGCRGQDVKNVQTACNYLLPDANPALNVDGLFGPKTKARVVDFQKTYGIDPIGKVGPKTYRAMFSFVKLRHHLLPRTYSRDMPILSHKRIQGARSINGTAKAKGVGSDPTAPINPFLLPPIPRMQLGFPIPFSVPHQLQPLKLTLDPQFALWLRTKPFEIESGAKLVFTKDPKESGGVIFTDVQATVWSYPLGEHVKTGVRLGGGVETRLNNGNTAVSLVALYQVEVVDILRFRNVDLAKIAAEAQISKDVNKQTPVDYSATIEAGPSIETKDGRFSFGAGGYMEYKTNGVEHQFTVGPYVKGAIVF